MSGSLGKTGKASSSPESYLNLLKMILLNETGVELDAALRWLHSQPGVPDAFWTDVLHHATDSIGDPVSAVRRERENGSQKVLSATSLSMIGRRRMDHLEQCVKTVLDEGIPGDG